MSIKDRIVWFYHTKIHFIQLHYLYILILTFITSALFYSQPGTHWNYIDALFMATSTVTNTGLNTINMSSMSLWQLVIMYVSSVAGSHITISDIILHIRKHYFSIRFGEILISNKKRQTLEANKRKFEKGLESRRLSFLSTKSTPNIRQHDRPRFFRFSMSSFTRKHRRITESLSLDDIYRCPDNHTNSLMLSTRCNSLSSLPSSSTLMDTNDAPQQRRSSFDITRSPETPGIDTPTHSDTTLAEGKKKSFMQLKAILIK